MKIYISTDMEGIMGVSSWNEMDLSVAGKTCNQALESELNWIIEALKASAMGQEIEEILICDSHARGENLRFGFNDDPRICHIKGYPRPFYMMEGLDQSFDLVMLVGYHAQIGAERAGMDHSYSASCIYQIRLNGEAVGEVEINALLAGLYNVPVGLISGDDVLETEMKSFYKKGIPFVRTKEGIGRFAAKMYAPNRIKESYQTMVQGLLEKRSSLEIKKPAAETVLEVDLLDTVMTDACAIIPGIKRIGGRTVRYQTTDYKDIYRMILTITMVGGRFVGFK